jgi:hypothetical protein
VRVGGERVGEIDHEIEKRVPVGRILRMSEVGYWYGHPSHRSGQTYTTWSILHTISFYRVCMYLCIEPHSCFKVELTFGYALSGAWDAGARDGRRTCSAGGPGTRAHG